MGQNHFSLMGELTIEQSTPDQIEIDGFIVPGIRATIQAGPDYANERILIYVTGQAAQIIYEWTRKKSKINVFLQGSLKSYRGVVWPVATYVRVYEAKTGRLSLETVPENLARTIQSSMNRDQIQDLVSRLTSFQK